MIENGSLLVISPTTGELIAWLTEVALQLGGVGRGAARTVDDEGSTAEPAAFLVDLVTAGVGQERFAQTAEQTSEDRQGQPLPRLAEGPAGEGLVTLSGQIIQCGVAVEHLEDEQMDCIGGIKQSILPGVGPIRRTAPFSII
jgi:hypothetical protein